MLSSRFKRVLPSLRVTSTRCGSGFGREEELYFFNRINIWNKRLIFLFSKYFFYTVAQESLERSRKWESKELYSGARFFEGWNESSFQFWIYSRITPNLHLILKEIASFLNPWHLLPVRRERRTLRLNIEAFCQIFYGHKLDKKRGKIKRINASNELVILFIKVI